MVGFAVFAVKNHLYVFIHNGVGSALLVLTMMGVPEPLCVGRVTYSSYAFFYLLRTLSGTGGVLYSYEEKVLLVAVYGIDAESGFL